MMNNMLPIGTLLRGDTYRVIRQLNSGGFGNTYVVENVHFGEIRAMKEFFMQGVTMRQGNTVSVSQSDNAAVFRSQKEKFKKEAQRIRKLNHPNIVKIYDLFEENDTYYYIMDYIDGESLAERLNRQGAMKESEVMQVLNSLLDALSTVHTAGLTHMDIKPGNIMRDRQGKIYLIDFGASKQMTSNEQRTLSTSTAMPYSKGYAPMEQVEQDMSKVGPWTDFYAVGATLYKLLTNQQPPTSNEIINNATPFFFPASISHSTRNLTKWLMQPARNKRPRSVDEIRNSLLRGTIDEETVYDGGNANSKQQPLHNRSDIFMLLCGIAVVIFLFVGLKWWGAKGNDDSYNNESVSNTTTTSNEVSGTRNPIQDDHTDSANTAVDRTVEEKIAFLKSFYKEYAANDESGTMQNYELVESNITSNCRQTLVAHYEYDDCDDCIAFWMFRGGGQDPSPDMYKTVKIVHDGDSWFLVTMKSYDEKAYIRIKVIRVNGKYKIDEVFNSNM